MEKVLFLLKKVLPTKRIGAWLLGLIAAALAAFLSIGGEELKASFCDQPTIELPKADPSPKDLPPPVEK